VLRSRKLWELGYWELGVQIPELLTQRNFVVSGTIRSMLLRFVCRFLSFLRSASLFQIPELLTQRKFVSVMIPELLTQRMFVSVKTMGARLLRFGVQSWASYAAQVCFSRVTIRARLLRFCRFRNSYAAQVCFSSVPRTQTAQTCGSYSLMLE